MAERPWLAPGLRPPAVAIHDDRHVLWQTAYIDQPHGERVSWGSGLSKNGDETLERRKQGLYAFILCLKWLSDFLYMTHSPQIAASILLKNIPGWLC
jgi:hypothetical protein